MTKPTLLLLASLVCMNALAGTSLSGTIDEVLRSGAEATLPPNLSSVLGLAKPGQATSVKQLIFRRGQTVHAFNVDPAHRHEIVLFSADEAAKVTTAYLMTPAGRLRKVVTYANGSAPVTIPRAHAQKEFAAERDAWLSVRTP